MIFARIWCITNLTPTSQVTPPWNVYMANFFCQLRGLPWQTVIANVIKLKWAIIWTGRLPHLSGLPHLRGVPHFHVNRPLVKNFGWFFSHFIVVCFCSSWSIVIVRNLQNNMCCMLKSPSQFDCSSVNDVKHCGYWNHHFLLLVSPMQVAWQLLLSLCPPVCVCPWHLHAVTIKR